MRFLNHIDIDSIIRIAGEAKDINVQPPYEAKIYMQRKGKITLSCRI